MKLSVVIPALDEAESIEAAVVGALYDRDSECGSLALRPPPRDADPPRPLDGVEVIVVDGGSSDATASLAKAAGARVIESERGRANQLRAGVRASGGDVVVMLHADTRLPRGWTAAIRDALRDERVVGGAFGLRFDDRSAAMRFIEWGVRLRVALWRLPYGDQALFVRRSALDEVGGVPPAPVMEDLDLVDRLKRRGRLALLPTPVVTSARRYRAGGPLRTMLRHWLAAAAWSLGADRARIARWVGR